MAAERKKSAGPILRLSVMIILGSGVLGAAIYSAQSFERFLIHDARFLVPGPPDYGEESPNLSVEGIQYASRSLVLHVFNQDFGRSLYLLPLEERRAALLHLSWVKDATVRRIWPNRLDVHITERKPAAFIPVSFGPMSRYALIDSDGVILDPPSKAQFNLPVLQGIQKNDTQTLRGQRVRRMQRMMREAGSLGNGISEVDVTDLDNLKVRLMMKDQSFLLILGDSGFTARLQNFFNHYQEIHNRIPWATTLDLRLEDRITAVGEAPSGQ
jgi:cell division protein FtsQ